MNIGKLQKVELRNLWKSESSDFTPWLAQEENIRLLSDTINIDLEIVQQEKNVGPFRADILCKSTIDGHNVLIENQIEKTDHTHLGQILTYAAGLDAVTIIWIAKKFTEEHRAAIDWLNRITDDKFNFFGIEIEVYKIGDSLPAPLFQIVSKPNDWSKSINTGSSGGELTERKIMNLEYWKVMKQYFEDKGTFLNHQKPQPQHWATFALGKTNIYLSAIIGSYEGFIKVELDLYTENAKNQFNQLKELYFEDSINEIGKDISWEELPNNKMSKIVLKNNRDPKIKSDWANQHKWFLETLEKFDKFFRPKIKNL